MNLNSFIQLQSLENLNYLRTETGKPFDFILTQLNKLKVSKFDGKYDLWEDVKAVNKFFINSYKPKAVEVGSNDSYDRFIGINVKGLDGNKIPWYDESDEAWEDGRLISAEERIKEYKIKYGMESKSKVPFAYQTKKFEFEGDLGTLRGDYPSYEPGNRGFNIKPRKKVDYN